MGKLHLYFVSGEQPCLDRIILETDSEKRILVRGRSGGAYRTPYTFAWTPAVKAFAYLALTSAAAAKLKDHSDTAEIGRGAITGGKNSLAASLDYAVSKKPNWVMDLFGCSAKGESLVGRYIKRSNAERKRGGEVGIALNERLVPSIDIYIDGEAILDGQMLASLRTSINPAYSAAPKLGKHPESLTDSTTGLVLPQRPAALEAGKGISCLEQLRQKQVVYLPPGPTASDLFMKEIYEYDGRIDVHACYYRFAMTVFPEALLEFMGVSKVVRQRNAAAFRAWSESRLQFTEIVNEAAVWDVIRLATPKRFMWFPSCVKEDDILGFLDHMIGLIKRDCGYRLFLSRTVSPFLVGTYELGDGPCRQNFSCLVQRTGDTMPNDYATVVVYDGNRRESQARAIVDWITSLETTKRDPSEVLDVLQQILRHLKKEGPLPPDTASDQGS